MKKGIITISLLFGFSAIAGTTVDPAHPVASGAGAWDNLTDKGERR